MQFRLKLASVAVAGAAAVTLLAVAPALASSHAHAGKAVTGPEAISGTVHGKAALAKAPRIPLQWQGLVVTKSVVTLGGGGGPHKGAVKTLTSPAGNLTVMVSSKPTQSQSINTKTCQFSFTQDIPVTVVGAKSTGAFAGASGPGAAQVQFSAIVPRYTSGPNKGKCNPNGTPIAKTAVASFLATAVLTIG
jgi:hypothetical protein